MKSFAVILCVFVVCGMGAKAQALSLNDLTILIPLPRVNEMALMLSPQDQGAQGLLLSKKTYIELVQLVPEVPNSITYRDSLKVIGIRIDPCFTEGVGPQNCRRQIRLVWQPVFHAGQTVSTRDAAVHSFYEFDDATFAKVWKDWQSLSSGSSSDALQIHPQLQQEGLQGAYWKYLRALILKYCGEKNIVRMTAMNVMSGEQLWIFSGFDIKNGEPQAMMIPRSKGRTQGVISSSSASRSFTGGMFPPPPEDPEFAAFVQDSSTTKKRLTEAQIKALMGKVHEYENPDRHNPGTLDCASCHLANTAHQWGQLNFRQWDWANDFKNIAFQSNWNLSKLNEGPLQTNKLRAFGYFVNQPAISQRVINETASVAMYLKIQQ
ncbi:hypothetical protein [Bdellovibrio svalbardensis]|uniref:Cytochrome c domain-containing protein n=1 Tax=Bdellovibrio svalbardensis TaxID=2972972 RepID=A0ABT6DGJ9_9BACT|nr:hypothetical protein [Bdellovibrio svalbardensis]MDG0815981.1 hypothetical protein [Bdellovibrio svalbardensis]